MTGTPDKTFEGMFRQLRRDVDILYRRLGGGGSGSSNEGSTATRDALFGVPGGSVPAQVALANRGIQWLNTDFGWVESYYAPTGSAGLTARGLVTGSAAGWYPVGPGGPEIVWSASASFAATSGSAVGGWNVVLRKRGNNTFIQENPAGQAVGCFIRVKLAGYYDVVINETAQTGQGVANMWLARWSSTGAVYRMNQGYPITLQPSFYESRIMQVTSHLAAADEFFGEVCHSGAFSVHMGAGVELRAQFLVRYIGPPLVNG